MMAAAVPLNRAEMMLAAAGHLDWTDVMLALVFA
jgi:hypothetical protein